MNAKDAILAMENNFVVLRPDMGADSISVSPSLYSELDQNYDGFKNHVLVSSHSFDSDWGTWEIHPAGDEVIYLLQGDVEFVLKEGAGNRSVRLSTPGTFAIVPKNTWHTAKVHAPTKMLFLTPGEGTRNADSPDD